MNMLAVGLSSCVYLWQANTSKVTKLCDLGIADHITAVHWGPKNNLVSLGTFSGQV
jgi:cell division cycle 20-like protein 1 (cofactor of APC complex)